MPIETAMPYKIIFHDLQFLLFHFILYVKSHHIGYNQSLLSDKKNVLLCSPQHNTTMNKNIYIFFFQTRH